jgi:hypothetical protein
MGRSLAPLEIAMDEISVSQIKGSLRIFVARARDSAG